MEVHIVDGFLDAAAIQRVNALFDRAVDRDGEATAGPWAAPVKRARQAIGYEVEEWCAELVDRIFQDRQVARFAYPLRATQPMLMTYGPGDEYGRHEDNPLQSGMRTDFSFTLFLTERGAYEGGELVLTQGSDEQDFKLPAGNLLLYRTGTEHFVRPVLIGQRRVAVGWLQSCFRDSRDRELLRDFSNALEELAERLDAQTELFWRLNRIRNELVRRWADT